jgi:hypothetical protein
MIEEQKPKQVYLKNKDLLAEIHRSKLSYCWVDDPKYTDYDVILYDLKHFHNRKTKAYPDGVLNIAKEARVARLAQRAHQTALAAWEKAGGKASEKPKLDEFVVSTKKIPTTDVVVRLMTWEHVPLEPGRKNNPKSLADHRSKVNFPPFKHFVQDAEGNWKEVVRSHWTGTLKRGSFSVDHGQLTNHLGAMFLKLCERYSLRSNWRGYSYIDEMRGQALIQLTQIALQFDEAKSNNPFAYYTAAVTNSFTRVLNVEKRQRDIRDDMLQESGQMPSWTRQMERSEQHHAEVERLNALKAEAAESELNKYNEEPYKDAMDMIDENVEEDLENAPVLEDDQP